MLLGTGTMHLDVHLHVKMHMHTHELGATTFLRKPCASADGYA